jgi:hypothetical protein
MLQSLFSVSVVDKQPRTIVACCLHPTNSSFSQALVNTFVETNRQCNANFKQSGSTATVVIVTGLKDRGGVGGSDGEGSEEIGGDVLVTVANVGDSHAFIDTGTLAQVGVKSNPGPLVMFVRLF